MHDVTLAIVAMSVSNKGCSPVRIHGSDVTPTPSGFAEIVSDEFPLLRTHACALLTILRHLWFDPTHFKLCTHLL